MDQIRADLRLAVRALIGHPGSSLLVIFTLAIGIAVNAVVFSLINGLLFKPPPFGDVDRVAWVHAGATPADRGPLTLDELTALQRSVRTAHAIAGESRMGLGMQTDQGTEQVWALLVSDNYFSVVHATPVRGRTFGDADRGRPTVLVSEGFWRQRFGDDTSLAGRTITLENQVFAIAGVLPDSLHGFTGPYRPEVWVPLSALDLIGLPHLNDSSQRWLGAAARLAPGAEHAHLKAELAAISAEVVRQTAPTGDSSSGDSAGGGGATGDASPGNASGNAAAGGAGTKSSPSARAAVRTFGALPVRDGAPEVRALRPVGFMALAAVGFVLLLACFNVTGLLLARASERQREMGVRAALGASQARLMRQVLVESLLLAAIASGAALIVAYWSHDLVSIFRLPSPIPQDIDMSLDWRLVLFAAGLAIAAGVVPGLASALHVRRLDLLRVLKNDDRGASGAGARGRKSLLLIEIAGSTFLLSVAVLFLQSFRQMASVEYGFEPTRALIVALAPANHGYRGSRAARYAEQVVQRVRAVPGVREAAVTIRPPAGIGFIDRAEVSTDTGDCTRADCPRASIVAIGPGYFEALRIPLAAGGGFESTRTPRRNAVVIDQRLAAQLWPGRAALGAWMRVGEDRTLVQVVGIARDVNHYPTSSDDVDAEVYRLVNDDEQEGGLSIVVGTHGDPARVASSVREAVQRVDADVPIARLQTMTSHLELAKWPARTLAGFSLTCAIVAVTLASVGLFGLTHRSVSQRLREFGVRSALGASQGQLLSLVLREGAWLTAPGVLAGIGAALLASSALRRLLLHVSPLDPSLYVVVALLQATVTLAACGLPARRAARVDPLTVLRGD